MNDPEKVKAPLVRLERYAWALAVVWTVVVAASLGWNVFHMKAMTLVEARIQAQVAYRKDILSRRWNAGHGGVYVPMTKKTRPNPYLSHIPERDIKTPSGRLLTLMNPAYMTRQMHELAKEEYGVHGHITSLNPIRPENAPDSWEASALRAFERGETEVSSVEGIEGKEYLRLIQPLITEKACLKCHAKQGYREGDIRGGISASIPMESLRAIERRHILTLTLAHSLLWLVGLGGIGLGAQRLRKNELERKRAEEALEASNKELEAFSYSVSHDLRAPLRSIDGFGQILLEDYADILDAQGKDHLVRVRSATQHMGELIDDLLKLSRVTRSEMKQVLVDLSALARAIAVELRKSQPERRVQFVIAPGAVANGDARLLRVLLENLLANAWKFTSKHPTARIEFGVTQLGEVGSQQSAVGSRQSQIVYFVRDDGAGFDMSYAGKLFGAFQRLHTASEFPGTGIGLATVQRIVYRHGGRVWAEGAVDQGATFYFTLP